MFLALFVLFLIAWVFGFVVFHVAGGLIHILLLVGAVFLVIHLIRPGKAAV